MVDGEWPYKNWIIRLDTVAVISSGTGLSGIERKNELISLNSNMTRILLKSQLIKFWWQDVLAIGINKEVLLRDPTSERLSRLLTTAPRGD